MVRLLEITSGSSMSSHGNRAVRVPLCLVRVCSANCDRLQAHDLRTSDLHTEPLPVCTCTSYSAQQSPDTHSTPSQRAPPAAPVDQLTPTPSQDLGQVRHGRMVLFFESAVVSGQQPVALYMGKLSCKGTSEVVPELTVLNLLQARTRSAIRQAARIGYRQQTVMLPN